MRYDGEAGNLNPWELTAEQKEFAEIHLKEHVEQRQELVNDIRNWILDNKRLCFRTDDFFILRFLRGCKFDVEKTKQKLISYYEQRAKSPEWFTKRDPYLPEIQELLELGVFLPLRTVDNEGRLVVIVRACVHNPRKHRQSDVLKAGMMLLDLASRSHVGASIYGVVAIHDMTGVQLAHGLQMTPGTIKRLVNTWQGYPNRIRSLDYVNAPGHVNFVLNIFKRFMSKKLRQRIHVHGGDGSSLLNKMSANVLPRELGGQNDDYRSLTNYWKQQAEENCQWYADDETYHIEA